MGDFIFLVKVNRMLHGYSWLHHNERVCNLNCIRMSYIFERIAFRYILTESKKFFPLQYHLKHVT